MLAKYIPIVLLLPLVMLIAIACGNDSRITIVDTCTQGDNMTNPRISGVFDTTLNIPELIITWDIGTEQGAGLPDAYFAEVSVAAKTDDVTKSLITSVGYSGSRELNVVFTDLGSYLQANNEIVFFLEFPDRAFHIDCTHSGMADRYFLNVTLNTDGAGNFTDAVFTQTVELGAI